MNLLGQLPEWRRLIALLSVLAVFLGLSAHENGPSRVQTTLSPAPLPELRAAPPLPGGPDVVGEPVPTQVRLASAGEYAPAPVRPPEPGFAPRPLQQSGAKRLEGG